MTPESSLPADLAGLLQDLRAARTGNSDAVLLRLLPRLRLAAKRHLPPNSPLRVGMDSEDLVQDTLLHLIANIDSFRGTTWAEFLSFTRTITSQKAADQARRTKAQQAEPSDPDFRLTERPSPDPTPSVHAAAAEDRERLNRMLEELPDPYRKTLRLRLEGHDSAAIAQMLDVSDDTVRTRLTRALKMLQDRW